VNCPALSRSESRGRLQERAVLISHEHGERYAATDVAQQKRIFFVVVFEDEDWRLLDVAPCSPCTTSPGWRQAQDVWLC
jgi:hypothetical protein